jgi:DNA-3-methyladenine glycosylase
VLFGHPGTAYVYRSYGIHALLNAVTGPEGEGAAVLLRALEPILGEDEMFRRRKVARWEDLANGPGKLTQALGIELSENNSSLIDGPISIEAPADESPEPRIVTGTRIGITKAADLPWRYCDADSRCVSRPWPPAMRVVRSP